MGHHEVQVNGDRPNEPWQPMPVGRLARFLSLLARRGCVRLSAVTDLPLRRSLVGSGVAMRDLSGNFTIYELRAFRTRVSATSRLQRSDRRDQAGGAAGNEDLHQTGEAGLHGRM